MTSPVRSQIFLVDEPEGSDPPKHYYVVISNNRRNAAIPSVLALMVTTTNKSHLPTAVQLSSADHPLVGYVVADNIVTLWDNDLTNPKGYMSVNTMQAIGAALAIALAL
jgi:mRNA interferase MazF